MAFTLEIGYNYYRGVNMGIFDKFKKIFNKPDVNEYDKALEKTRSNFTSKLGNLSKKYKELTNEYFDDLEEILIMADIGVDTVMKLVDKLKKRVKEVAALQNELSTVQKRINSIEDKYLDGDLTKEEYNRMLERYTKEASAMQQQIEMRENPNRSNIEPKLNYSINLINNIDSYIRNASVGVKIKLISSMFPEKIEFDGKTYRTNSYNKVLDLIYQQTNELRGVEKKSGESFSTFSASVPRPGVEPGWK